LFVTTFSQSITKVTPSSGEKGTLQLPITITGSGTSFSNATTTIIEIIQGTHSLKVNSASVVNNESINATISISNVANKGFYTVRAWDSNVGMIEFQNGFVVLENTTPPEIVNTTPDNAAVGQQLPITISMSNAHFTQATNQTMHLTQGTTTIYPISEVEVLNDNYIRATFDLGQYNLVSGSVLDAHCYNDFDGSLVDVGAVEIGEPTKFSVGINYVGQFNGTIELYQQHEGSNPVTYSLVGSSIVPVSNTVSFLNVPIGKYVTRCIPDTHVDAVATYFPDQLTWEKATVIVTAISGPFSTYYITPFSSVITQTGQGTLSGSVSWGPDGFAKSSTVLAEGIEVFIHDVTNSLYLQAVTDSYGMYNFTGIPSGDYDLVINLPGYKQTSTYTFNLTESSTKNDFDFIIDNGAVFTTLSAGMEEIESEPLKKELKIYPNPTKGSFKIDFTDVPNEFTVRIYNSIGVLVSENSIMNNHNTYFSGDISSLSEGLYLLKISGVNLEEELRIVKTK
jgi:hypothetical protein